MNKNQDNELIKLSHYFFDKEIWATKIEVSKKQLVYSYISKITSFENYNVISTFLRIFCYFISIMDFILGKYFLGIICLIPQLLCSWLGIRTYIFCLKREKFNQLFKNNPKKYARKFEKFLFDNSDEEEDRK